MFDDLFTTIAIGLVIGGIGWVLGIVAFVRSGRLLREVAELRAAAPADMARPPEPAAAFAMPEAAVLPEQPAAVVDPPEPAWESELPKPAAPPPSKAPSRGLEELLTARWGVWLGAAALLLAGVFLVRYAAEEGLLGPAVRCIAAALLGAALVVGGLVLARRSVGGRLVQDQAPAALGAGGVVMLFGAAYAASVLYDLVPPLVGFVLMAAASFTALLVALRLGQLVAAVGIVGAFVTPALVQTTEPSWPGLFAYLLVVAAASLAVVRYAAWVWLGWATANAGAVWVVVATLAGRSEDDWAPALFAPALAALHLALLPAAGLAVPVGRRLAWVPVALLGAAGLLLALTDPGAATRAGVLLLAPVTLVAAAREPRLAALPWIAAALFLLLVAFWGLPAWNPTGEGVFAEDRLMAVLPGDWTPEALRPLLLTTLGMAGLFALAGLVLERRLRRPLPWSALTAAVPVLALGIAYARVRLFQPDLAWAAASLVLAAGLTVTAAVAARDRGDAHRQRAGVHAAGATAALALGFAMLLSAQWLTIALVLLLPALAWIEAAADLPALRPVALAVAGVALARLLLNSQVLDYVDGQMAVLNGRALAYLIAAISFLATARMARRRADDRLVAVLELGAAAFVTALIVLEIRQWATAGLPTTPHLGFREAAMQTSAMAVLASIALRLDRRAGRAMLGLVWRVQGGLALVGAIGLLIVNPMLFGGQDVGETPFLDAMLAAYALPALLAVAATRDALLSPGLRRTLSVYAIVAVFIWITLEVRHIAHPAAMGLDEAAISDGELWSWSAIWMVFGGASMAAGLALRRRDLRRASLAVMALVIGKVFLVDMSGLTGLWRALSFLGLGLTLIAMGSLYSRFAARFTDPPGSEA